MTFRDHFSGAAPAYAAFRPRYPDDLFAFLAERAPGRRLAWDCATGSGQAAVGLAAHFDRVEATDASAGQIAAAAPHPRVGYRVAAAEVSGLADASADLVTVAQALHWLDRDAFFREARRVLRPGGLLAAWCYNRLAIGPDIDAHLGRFFADTVGPYWPPERALVEDGYRGIDFPFAAIATPEFAIVQDLTLAALAGYLRTWSATLRYVAARGDDPVAPLVATLGPLWGDPDRPRRARWPLHLRAGRAD
jgi:SAM-dependent methyltransferase